ncbi:hypothetical protein EJ04DRAFT_513978 [Polyplosphaeria fusca]|uniref:Uncharacterized protein n=1 Tax=Polyplosphaeria fusca TaxID=682080 RepID=A0A9P4UZD2_9PLEO|nr:hypothetical protein EJ04DRAFT_513978 [Polyplosphaeria fusca]
MSSSDFVDSCPPSSCSSLVGIQQRNHAALPSMLPLSPDEDAGAASSPDVVVRSGLAPASSIDLPSLLEDTVAGPFPLPPAAPEALPSPAPDLRPDLGFNFAGCHLPPTDVSLLDPPVVKASQNLRLPSFDVLGIAAPHPDRIPLRRSTTTFSSLGAGPLSKPDDPLHENSPPLSRPHQFGAFGEPPTSTPVIHKSQVEQIVPIVTPPSEPGIIHWGSFVNVRTAAAGSPPYSDSGASPSPNITTSITTPVPPSESAAHTLPILSGSSEMEVWTDGVKGVIISNLESQQPESIKILSHALPCPSVTGHLFGQIIAAIHGNTAAPTAWINVFHAVPGRFTLEDLPKSPPSTPGPVVGGDEYFTSKVFDSAVAVPDYANYQFNGKLLPPSPRPVVAPGSVNISVVERYIPPTNAVEFTEMFSMKGHSLLYDRLVELSTQNGLLLFIYPTRTGGRTFMRDYLGPVIDPLLRTVTVVHDLSSDLGNSLGHMSSVEKLMDFKHLQAAMEGFCERLGQRSSGSQGASTPSPTYSVVHASKEEVVLDRQVWASDWWIKQEKPRVRETVTKYFRKAQKLPTTAGDTEMTPTNLIQEVLDGVARNQYGVDTPANGVEVGIFIVQKTAQ